MAAPVSSTGQAMEDVLDLYAEPYDPDRPLVCFDETSTQLLAEVREPLPPQPGRPRRQDYEYRRGGTRNIFLTCEPLAGWRRVAITERRTMQDFAHQMQWLVDVAYLDATVVRVVLDNLNSHRMASLYETFPAVSRAAHREAPRVSPHAHIRQLVEHGGDRIQRIEVRLSQGEKPRRRRTATQNHGLRDRAQRGGRHHQLAVQHSRCPIQIASPLSRPFQT